MEQIARNIALHLSLAVELLAAIIIGIGILQFLFKYVPGLFKKNQHTHNTWLRVQFGSSLTIALELLLAADILETAVAPTWEDIGKLAAIAAIRTALNYFLEKEMKDIINRVDEKPKYESLDEDVSRS